MQCPSCNNVITPGMAISLSSGPGTLRHCPYCVAPLPDELHNGTSRARVTENDVSVERFEHRRRVREQFVERLLRSSPDGAPHCPICDHRLSKNDELALRNAEHFRCHLCARDLATVAYREVAYDQQHWLPVIGAVADLKADAQCCECAYLGAVAKACQHALSCIPKSMPSQDKLIRSVLARQQWALPHCDRANSCIAVQQYRDRAAEGVALL